MRTLIIILGFVFCVAALGDIDWNGEKTKQKTELADQQRQYLVELEAMNNAAVSEFVRDWRNTYPKATPSSVEELALAVQIIRNDTSRAAAMTVAGKRKAESSLSSQIEPVFGWSDSDPKPGL